MTSLLRSRVVAPIALLLTLALSTTACGVFGGDGSYEVRAEFARTYNLFPGSPVRVLGVEVGKITDLHVGLKGTMNALFLKDLADKTRRGLRGRVELGKSGGGLCYGFKVKRATGDGGAIGEREIVLAEGESHADHADNRGS